MGTLSNVAVPCRLNPYLIVRDASAAIEFYKATLGAVEVVRLEEPGGKVAHAELKIGQAVIMLADEYPDMGYRAPGSDGTPVSLLLYVDDVDARFTALLSAGAKQIMEVSDQFDGDRRGTLVDPFGHVWLIATKREEVAPDELRARFQKMLGQGG
jgi:PhnB protein